MKRLTDRVRVASIAVAVFSFFFAMFLVWGSSTEADRARRIELAEQPSRFVPTHPGPAQTGGRQPEQKSNQQEQVSLEVRVFRSLPGAHATVPAANARVDVYRSSDHISRVGQLLDTAVCGGAGESVLSLPSEQDASPMIVRAVSKGFVPVEKVLTGSDLKQGRVTLVLRPGVVLAGAVETPDGRRLPGLDILAIGRPNTRTFDVNADTPIGMSSVRYRSAARAGKNGEFEFTVAPGAVYSLQVRSPDWIQLVKEPVAIAQVDLKERILKVFPVREFRLRLLDRDSLKPIVKPHLGLSPNDETARYRSRGSGRIHAEILSVAGSKGGASSTARGIHRCVMWWPRESAVPTRMGLAVTDVLGYRAVVTKVALQLPSEAKGWDEVRLTREAESGKVGTVILLESPVPSGMQNLTTRMLRVPVGGKWGWDFISGCSLGGNRWIYFNVPAGNWSVAVGAGAELWSRPNQILVVAGAESEITISFPDPSGVRFYARDAGGAKLDGFDVILERSTGGTAEEFKQCAFHRATDGEGVDQGRTLLLRPGRYRVSCVLKGRAASGQEFSLAEGEIKSINIVFEHSGR